MTYNDFHPCQSLVERSSQAEGWEVTLSPSRENCHDLSSLSLLLTIPQCLFLGSSDEGASWHDIPPAELTLTG